MRSSTNPIDALHKQQQAMTHLPILDNQYSTMAEVRQ
jgi:hypothetical protein